MAGREKYTRELTPKQRKKNTSGGVLARHLGVWRKCVSFMLKQHGELAVKLGGAGRTEKKNVFRNA